MPIISWFGLDLVAAPGREARRGRDRVGERHERDADGGDEQRSDVADATSTGNDGVGKPLRERADGRDTVGGEVEHGRDDGGADHRDQDGRDPWA